MLPNQKETGWAQAEDLLVPAFMILNSNSEASLARFYFGAALTAQLFSVIAEGHISCVQGNVDALRSTPTAASNVLILLFNAYKKINISSIFLKRLKDFMD